MLVLGGVLAALAAFLAGASGFGLGLVATPLLLLSGFSLPFVVTVNLLISLATRVSVMWRMRRWITWRRAAALVGGAVPGLWLGSLALGAFDLRGVRVAAGLVVTVAALGLAWVDRHPPKPRLRGMNLVAGFLGGVLGTTTSLTGVPPALLLTRRRLAQPAFFADLAVYFVASSAVGLVILGADGHFSGGALRAFLWWLPAVLAANAAGMLVGFRLAENTFRRTTLVLAFAAGIATAATA
ncbi:MAG: uncharacterized protein QOH16_3801 [Gaiellaceae bacterium]|nr:uncharacterized protein [Gaiellaceae bacterium]